MKMNTGTKVVLGITILGALGFLLYWFVLGGALKAKAKKIISDFLKGTGAADADRSIANSMLDAVSDVAADVKKVKEGEKVHTWLKTEFARADVPTKDIIFSMNWDKLRTLFKTYPSLVSYWISKQYNSQWVKDWK